MNRNDSNRLRELAARTRYPLDAFQFVRRGLDFTVHRAHRNPERLPEDKRHVSGRQLSAGLRDFAVEQYGLLARTVLKRWRIQRTEDFGQIVFAMVNAGIMQATENDTLSDFDSVYPFDEGFEIALCLNPKDKQAQRPRPVGQE